MAHFGLLVPLVSGFTHSACLPCDLWRSSLVYGPLERVHVALAAVERSPGDVHTHRVDTNIVYVVKRKQRRKKRTKSQHESFSEETSMSEVDIISFTLTDIMGLIENNYRLLGQLFRHQVGYFGVEKVMVAVNYNVGMQDLQKRGDERETTVKREKQS